MLTYEAIRDIVDIVVPPGTYNTVELEPEFAKKVRLTNVILKSNNPISYEDIRRAAGDCYFQVALKISTAKYINSRNDFQWTEEDILAMMTPAGQGASLSPITRLGSFSGGIEWAVARLTSAALTKNIPLQNSSLKFMDAAKEFALQAEEDIERIIKLITSAATNITEDINNENVKGQAYFYIAHDLNTLTLPETVFNTPDLIEGTVLNPTTNKPYLIYSSPATYDKPVRTEELKRLNPAQIIEPEVVSTFSVPLNKVGVCYFYMTGQADNADQDLINTRTYSTGLDGAPQTSQSVSYKIEKVFKVIGDNETKNIDDLISLISEHINSEALEATNGYLTNVLTAANRGQNKLSLQTSLKRELYPNTTLLKNRKVEFQLYNRINKLAFDVRRYSNKASTELLTIGFYTINETDIPSFITTNPSPVNVDQNIRNILKAGSLGIPGLIFGSVNNYSSLNNTVPYSALLNVEKGNVAAVSISDSGGGTNPTDNLANSDASNTIDTFYFACTRPANPHPFLTDLRIRVSSTTLSNQAPLDIIVDLSNPLNPFSDPNILGSLSLGEQVANRVVDAIYDYTRTTNINTDTTDNSNILGVVLGDYQRISTIVNITTGTATQIPLEEIIDGEPQANFTPLNATPTNPNYQNPYLLDELAGRVQIVSYRYRDEEYRIVVELVQVPENLWVGTGNYILRRTQWGEGKRRGVTLDTKVLSSGNITLQTSSEELSSVKASVSNIEASKSKLLQSVFDKRKHLNDAQKGFINKWQYPT